MNVVFRLGVVLALVIGFVLAVLTVRTTYYDPLIGEDIGNREAKRFRGELADLAKKTLDSPKNDSPVYTFLRQLPENGFIDIAAGDHTPQFGSSARDPSTWRAGGSKRDPGAR